MHLLYWGVVRGDVCCPQEWKNQAEANDELERLLRTVPFVPDSAWTQSGTHCSAVSVRLAHLRISSEISRREAETRVLARPALEMNAAGLWQGKEFWCCVIVLLLYFISGILFCTPCESLSTRWVVLVWPVFMTLPAIAPERRKTCEQNALSQSRKNSSRCTVKAGKKLKCKASGSCPCGRHSSHVRAILE